MTADPIPSSNPFVREEGDDAFDPDGAVGAPDEGGGESGDKPDATADFSSAHEIMPSQPPFDSRND